MLKTCIYYLIIKSELNFYQNPDFEWIFILLYVHCYKESENYKRKVYLVEQYCFRQGT